jgi:trehalose 6-phosphate phosphatase
MRNEPTEDAKVLTDWLGKWLSDGGSLLFMTDYDGTLTPHVPNPAEAWIGRRVQRHLSTLARAPQVRVAIISGRDLGDVRARVGVAGAVYAGCHGLQVDGPGIAFSHPEALAQQRTVQALGEALTQRAAGIEGVRVEPKRLGITVHYRDVPDEARRLVEVELEQAIEHEGGRLKIFHGTKAIEILPQVAWSKGHCAAQIRDWAHQTLARPMLSVYIGDDWTDERAFEALVGLAITVRVGTRDFASRATYRLDGVEAVHELIECLAAAVGWRSSL